MCGIVGIYSFKNKVESKTPYIKWCLKTMQHRGPDSNGIWHHNNYITGFVRLAIRDVSTSASQPMISNCGNYCLTFNGEIYNADNYKIILQNKGVRFVSTSDTEILLYALIHLGLEFVLKEFDGMFAFSFYNKINNEVVVARDRVGIKPLYIGWNKKEDIVFSSQYDHIINYENIANEPLDSGVIASFLQLGYVAGGFGVVNNTQLLPHGNYIKINQQGYKIVEYYQIHHNQVDLKRSVSEDNLVHAVQSQLISDVPLASFMSGGVDSSLITLLANRAKPIKAFTISTGDIKTDERENAEWFAKKFSIPHHVQSISEEEIKQMVTNHVNAYTEPFADYSSLPSLLVSQVAQKEVKVVLSGDGPDELFWGYARNVKMIKLIKKFNRSKLVNLIDFLLSKLDVLPKTISKQFLRSKTFGEFYYNSMFIYGSAVWASKIFPIKPKEALFSKKIRNNEKQKNSLDGAMNTIWNYEMNIHLQRILLKMDRASMYNSLESRVPYLNNELIEIASSMSWKECIDGTNGKNNIKQILAQYTGNDFVYSSKKGFDIPIHDWINGSLKELVYNTVFTMPIELKNLFNMKQVSSMFNNHYSKKELNGNMIWAVFVLVSWYNNFRNSYSINNQ